MEAGVLKSGVYSMPSARRRSALSAMADIQQKETYFWTTDKEPEVLKELLDVKLSIRYVTSSGRHFGAITNTGQLLMWGNGSSGQLGNGSKESSERPIFVEEFLGIEIESALCAAAQSAAITCDGKLYIWGWRGQEPVFKPELVSQFEKKRVTKVSLGAYHVMAMVESDGDCGVYTWGNNEKGQLGNGLTTYGKEPELVDLGGKIVADICASETSSGIITNTGAVWVWGNNTGGIMLGINCSDEIVPTPSEITALAGVPVIQLDFGIEFGAVLSNTGDVYTWGKNSQGQLGVGDRANRTIPEIVRDLEDHIIIGISCGNKSMMAWSHTEIFSWGSNNRNQLGHSNLKEIPYICQPKLVKGFPEAAVIFDASCGNGSLALIGIAKIQVKYKEKTFEEEVDEKRTVGDLKTFVSPLWGMDSGSVVLQDSTGQLLNQKKVLRDLIIEGRSVLCLVPKSEVQIGDQEDMKFIFDDSDVPTVKLGSVEQLIRWLVNPLYPSDEYLHSFLLTYRMFVAPVELLDKLIHYFHNPHENTFAADGGPRVLKSNSRSTISVNLPELEKLRIVEVIRNWLVYHQYDFFDSKAESTQLLINLHRFIDATITHYDRAIAFDLTRLYHQMDPSRTRLRAQTLKFAPESLKPLSSGDSVFLSYPIKEVARQLCLVSHEMLAGIQPKELIGLAWTKPDKFTRSPNVHKMIHHSNKVSSWVCLSILSQSSTKKKIRMYEKFVDLALECLDLKNYNSLMEIISGLQSNSLLKFSKNWPNFNSTTNQYVDKVEKISRMLIARNKSELREKLKYASPPAIPFLGMYLQDLLFLEEGNKDQIDGLINFRKCEMIGNSIRSLQFFQRVPYEFHPVKELKSLLELNEETTKKESGAEPAEAQLTFLNNTSMILVDREKTVDFQGERASIWIQWCEKIDNDNVRFLNEDETPRSFLSLLLESFAIENSLYSVMTNFPKNDYEVNLFRRLLDLCFIPEINADELLFLLRLARRIKLPKNLRAILAQAICTFKNIVPHASRYPTIPRYTEDSKPNLKEEPEDLSVLRGKRKKCNRAAIKLCKVATMMISGNDHMEIFPLLYRGLHPSHLIEVRNFPVTKRDEFSAELQTLKTKQASILPLTGEGNENTRKLEQEKRQLDTSIKENEERLGDVEKESSFITGEIEKLDSKQKEYYHKLASAIEGQEANIERLGAVENMLVHIISLTEEKGDTFESVESRLTPSIDLLGKYFENQLKSMDIIESKLSTLLNDISVMGARYGAAVTKALEFDYSQTNKSFALSLQHLDFAFNTLEELQETAAALPSSVLHKKISHLCGVKLTIEEKRDKIIATHLKTTK